MTTKDYDDPLKRNYLKILRIFMTFVGIWPWNHRILKYITFIFTTWSTIGFINFLINYNGIDITFYGELFIILGLSFVGLGRTLLPFFKTYEKIYDTFLYKFHLIHFRHKQGYYEEMYKKVEKASDIFVKFIIITWILSQIFFNVIPIYRGINTISHERTTENVTVAFSLNWDFPGYPKEKPFILTSIINICMTWICTATIIGTDISITLMAFQIIGHIKILEHNLRNLQYVDPTDLPQTSMNNFGFPREIACHMFDHNTNLIIGNQLKSCVDHHLLIVSFANELSNFFGPTLAYIHLFHLLGCCLALFECIQGDPAVIVRFTTLAFVIFAELGHVSIIFEMVLTASENLPSALYACPWERMNIQNRRLVSIMLLRMQTPIQVTALGITKIGVQTMASILKASFSYFTFLRSKNN